MARIVYKNLVLSGGGFKAASFIGCLKCLEEKSILGQIQNIIGSSAGVIIGIMYCIGLNTSEMYALMKEGMKRYVEKEVDIDDILEIFESMGIDDGSIFVNLLKEQLLKKFKVGDLNFRDFSKLSGKNMIIIGSNISTATIDYFSLDTTPDMSIVTAFKISIAIPYLMKPVIHNDNLYVDASLFNNFPVDYFSDQKTPFQDTIALCLTTPFTKPTLNDLNILKFSRILMYSMFLRMNEKKIDGKRNMIINIDFEYDNFGFDMDTLKLVMKEEHLESYMEHGYKETQRIIADLTNCMKESKST